MKERKKQKQISGATARVTPLNLVVLKHYLTSPPRSQH